MKKIIFVLLLLPTIVSANVGKISFIKGMAFVGETPLQINDLVQEGDKLRTGRNSFLKITMTDNTLLTMAPKTQITISRFRILDGKRDSHIKLIQGKLRSLINKHARDGEKIRFDAKLVSLAVRGTEFITSTAIKGGAPSTDTLLLKGSLKASGTGFESFVMKPGEFFNSQDIVRMGSKAIKTLSPEVLDTLKNNSLSFGPSLAKVALAAVSPLVASAPSLGAAMPEEKEVKEEMPVVTKEKKETSFHRMLGQEFTYNIKKEPWDIRDAVMNREKYKKENKCFFFFYKKLPGSGEPERFRRERDCDEFEFDL